MSNVCCCCTSAPERGTVGVGAEVLEVEEMNLKVEAEVLNVLVKREREVVAVRNDIARITLTGITVRGSALIRSSEKKTRMRFWWLKFGPES